MSILVIVDPAWHEKAESKASIYEDKGGIQLHLKKVLIRRGCDAYDTAKWIDGIKRDYPQAIFKVEDNGPGALIIQILEEKIWA